MGLDERVMPIRQHPKSDETTSKAHLKPGWMGILPAVTIFLSSTMEPRTKKTWRKQSYCTRTATNRPRNVPVCFASRTIRETLRLLALTVGPRVCSPYGTVLRLGGQVEGQLCTTAHH